MSSTDSRIWFEVEYDICIIPKSARLTSKTAVEAAEAAASEAAAAEPAAAEAAGAHASPTAEAVGPGCPTAKAPAAIAEAAERARSSECAVITGPGIGTTGIEVPGLFPIEIVYAVRASPEAIGFGSVVDIVVARAVVIAAVVITAVPCGIAVEVIVVVDYGSAAPVTIPGIPPSAA